MTYHINADIRAATTLPGAFYTDPHGFKHIKETIFARSWQIVVGAEQAVRFAHEAMPFLYMEGCIDEPLILLRDADETLRCLSNVCTHRGKIIVEQAGKVERGLICGYHGRRFHLDGTFAAMPEMREALHFPCEDDHLRTVPSGTWRQFAFCSLNPAFAFEELVADMERKIGFMPIEQFRFDPLRSRDYLVKANWALYCDNYLEGFHIPFVHKALAATLDWSAYRTELYKLSNVQVGISKGGEHVFALPKEHEDYGQEIAGYYFWLFPNMMFNFYPWGLSLNIVRPLTHELTKVSFRTYVWKPELLGKGAGADLDLVEREDEAVVEQVQTGVKSRFYKHGRFSPSREEGVHHFHRLASSFL